MPRLVASGGRLRTTDATSSSPSTRNKRTGKRLKTGYLYKCPPSIRFKFTGVKGDGKEGVLRQKLAAELDN